MLLSFLLCAGMGDQATATTYKRPEVIVEDNTFRWEHHAKNDRQVIIWDPSTGHVRTWFWYPSLRTWPPRQGWWKVTVYINGKTKVYERVWVRHLLKTKTQRDPERDDLAEWPQESRKKLR